MECTVRYKNEYKDDLQKLIDSGAKASVATAACLCNWDEVPEGNVAYRCDFMYYGLFRQNEFWSYTLNAFCKNNFTLPHVTAAEEHKRLCAKYS